MRSWYSTHVYSHLKLFEILSICELYLHNKSQLNCQYKDGHVNIKKRTEVIDDLITCRLTYRRFHRRAYFSSLCAWNLGWKKEFLRPNPNLASSLILSTTSKSNLFHVGQTPNVIFNLQNPILPQEIKHFLVSCLPEMVRGGPEQQAGRQAGITFQKNSNPFIPTSRTKSWNERTKRCSLSYHGFNKLVIFSHLFRTSRLFIIMLKTAISKWTCHFAIQKSLTISFWKQGTF